MSQIKTRENARNILILILYKPLIQVYFCKGRVIIWQSSISYYYWNTKNINFKIKLQSIVTYQVLLKYIIQIIANQNRFKSDCQVQKYIMSKPTASNNETSINIVLQKEGQTKWPISLKQNVMTTSNGDIILSDIMLKLKQQNFSDFFDSSVSYFDVHKNVYIYCFFLPKTVSQQDLQNSPKYNKIVPKSALKSTSQLECQLKFRKKIKTKIQMLKEQQRSKFNELQEQAKKGKQKQKSVAQVIQKVALWRKLYTGFQNQQGQIDHLQLQKAAQQIGVVKKTLDDYLLQIRNGKRYGFNFHKLKHEKIGDLRSFVKGKREKK